MRCIIFVIGSKAIAIADAFNVANTLKYHLEKVSRKTIQLRTLTDKKSQIDALTKAKCTTGK